MIERNEFRFWLVYLLGKAKNLQTASNDYQVIPWSKVAEQLNMDPSNLSKIVSGVTDCKATTFLAIIKALGCNIEFIR